MKQAICIFLILWQLPAAFSQTNPMPLPEKQILSLLDQQLRAANAHDTDAFLATYLHDPALVFVLNGEVIRGWNNLHDRQLKWWKNGKSDIVYTQQAAPEFFSFGSDSVLVTQQLEAHSKSADGSSNTRKFVVTSAWRHLSDGWRVVYCHESGTR